LRRYVAHFHEYLLEVLVVGECLRYKGNLAKWGPPHGFTYEHEVSLPLFAHGPLHGGASTYSLLIAAFGFGSVAGGLYCVHRPQTGVPRMIRAAVLYAAAMLGTALTSQTYLAIALLIVVGVASIIFLTTGNSTIQIAARPDMRGRVVALWSTALVGSTPIGATMIGAVGDSAPRFALILGAAACAAAAAMAAAILRRSASRVAGARIPVSGKRSHVGDGTTSDRGRLAHATQRAQEHVEQRSG
jgi:MFS family permease